MAAACRYEGEKDRVLSSQAAHQLMQKVVEKLRAKAKCPTRKAREPKEMTATQERSSGLHSTEL
jgi:hypothetical protein